MNYSNEAPDAGGPAERILRVSAWRERREREHAVDFAVEFRMADHCDEEDGRAERSADVN